MLVQITLWTSFLIILLIGPLVLAIKYRISTSSPTQANVEDWSRTLAKLGPIGLGIISLKTRKPLLQSDQFKSLEETTCIPGGDLSVELCEQFLVYEKRLHNQGSASTGLELDYTTPTGTQVYLLAKFLRVRYRGEDALVVTLTDITVYKCAEIFAQQAKRIADTENKAKSEFLAVMSHEIRTSLQVILANLEFFQHSKLGSRQQERLTMINTASNDLLSTINNILDFSKIEASQLSLQTKSFDLQELFVQALLLYAPIAQKKGIVLRSDLGPHTSQFIRCDPLRVTQILNNLLSNAIKFTAVGSVKLTAKIEAKNNQMVVIVEDTGIGMSTEQISSIFEKFAQADLTTHSRFRGTGLGLAICDKLVEALDGSLTVTSELGVGSRFVLKIPVTIESNFWLPKFQNHKIIIFSDEYCAELEDSLVAWGLQPEWYFRVNRPTAADSIADAIVIVWGECKRLDLEQVSRLVTSAAYVIECGADGPGSLFISGRLISISMHSLGGLAQALEFVLLKRMPPKLEPSHYVLPRRIKVLLVEDHPISRLLLQEQLNLIGCETTTTSNGADAIKLLSTDKYEVVLSDFFMPEMSGYELATEVRKICPTMPILILTADVTLQAIESFSNSNYTKMLCKPLSTQALSYAISELTGVIAVREAIELPNNALQLHSLPKDLLKIFKAANENSLSIMKNAWITRDVATLLSELHAVRGVLSVYGLEFLSTQGKILSDELSSGHINESHDLFLRFCLVFSLALDIPLSHCVRSRQHTTTPT